MAAARSLTCLVLSSASCLLVLLSLLLPQSTVTFFLLPNGHSTISISSTRIRAQTRSVVATSSPSSPLFSSSSFSSSTCFPQMMRKQQQHDDLAEEQQLQQKSGVLPRLGRIVKMTIFPSIVTALGMAVQPAHAYRDMRMSPETRIVAASKYPYPPSFPPSIHPSNLSGCVIACSARWLTSLSSLEDSIPFTHSSLPVSLSFLPPSLFPCLLPTLLQSSVASSSPLAFVSTLPSTENAWPAKRPHGSRQP